MKKTTHKQNTGKKSVEILFKFMKKHWLTNTQFIEIVKKSGPVGELNPGPLDVRSRTLPLRHTGWSLILNFHFGLYLYYRIQRAWRKYKKIQTTNWNQDTSTISDRDYNDRRDNQGNGEATDNNGNSSRNKTGAFNVTEGNYTATEEQRNLNVNNQTGGNNSDVQLCLWKLGEYVFQGGGSLSFHFSSPHPIISKQRVFW